MGHVLFLKVSYFVTLLKRTAQIPRSMYIRSNGYGELNERYPSEDNTIHQWRLMTSRHYRRICGTIHVGTKCALCSIDPAPVIDVINAVKKVFSDSLIAPSTYSLLSIDILLLAVDLIAVAEF